MKNNHNHTNKLKEKLDSYPGGTYFFNSPEAIHARDLENPQNILINLQICGQLEL